MKRSRSRQIAKHLIPRSRFALRMLAVILPLLAACAADRTTQRPEPWGDPVHLASLENVWVIDGDIYRGPQLDDPQLRTLKQLGVKSVLNVRARKEQRDVAEAVGLEYFHIPITAYAVENEQVLKAMTALLDPAHRPVFVHCTRGGDRTGMLIALYRILVQGWSKDEAIEEMTEGYNFLPIWHNMVTFIRELDVADWRQRLGLTEQSEVAGES